MIARLAQRLASWETFLAVLALGLLMAFRRRRT